MGSPPWPVRGYGTGSGGVAGITGALDHVRTTQDGNVLAGELEGVALRGPEGVQVALFAAQDDPAQAPSGPLRYRAPAAAALHVLSGLAAGQSYQVQVRRLPGSEHEISLTPGAGAYRVSPQGHLRLRLGADGSLK